MSTWSRASCAALVAVPIICSRPSSAQDRPAIAMRLFEQQALGNDVVIPAQIRVDTILGRAGIAVVWRLCPSTPVANEMCSAAPEPREVVVRLVSGPPPISPHACGVTLVPRSGAAHFVTVFPSCVLQSADSLGVPADAVLACSLAHEIGHVFLGPYHGPVGLMQVQPRLIDWVRGAHDSLLFTNEESRRLKDEVVRRARLR